MRCELDDSSIRIIGVVAAKLKRYPVFRDYDLDDIKMDLTVHLLEEMREFDESLGTWERFVVRRLQSKGADLLRAHSRGQFAFSRERCVSLEVLTEADSGNENSLVDTLEDKNASAREYDELMILQEVMARLPEDLAMVAERLQTMSKLALATEMGLPYSTFRHRYIRRLAAHFKALGIGWPRE